MVPLLLSEPLNSRYRSRAARGARNYEIFDYLCNGVRKEREMSDDREEALVWSGGRIGETGIEFTRLQRP